MSSGVSTNSLNSTTSSTDLSQSSRSTTSTETAYISSGITITRLEVYVTNRSQNTETLRNIVGFSDLGEGAPTNPYNPNNGVVPTSGVNGGTPVNNKNNTLYNKYLDPNSANTEIRKADQTTSLLVADGLDKGTDFDVLRGAKKLTEREYRFSPELGYISLITPLRNDEVLAVSYEYTMNGQKYKVGELTEDYQNRQDNEVLVLKLLKSSTVRNVLNHPMWNLMMKNVYSLNGSQISKTGFQLRVIYKDDNTGIDNPSLLEGRNLKDIPLVQALGLDKMNQNGDRQTDGNFDFIEGVTVDSRNGKIIFPVLEPFGGTLRKKFEADESQLVDKYVFDKLYTSTLADAQQIASKNKFFLKGSYQSSLGGDVNLPLGVDGNSVQVTAGGVSLTPGVDYIVEPQVGRVKILNSGISNSGREIRICYEKPDLFNNQIRTLLGTHIDYTLGKDIHLGGTLQRLSETPPNFLRRVQMGNEPINNTMFGLDAAIQKKVVTLDPFG
jgi:cell surface protein SprA